MGVTNGTSVELVAFRNGGREAISKSSQQKLRVWDLTDIEDVAYREVENSHDIMAVCGNFAYGGTDQLSVVDLDVVDTWNRTEMILPAASSAQLENGQRRRRAMRSIKKIAGTTCRGRIDVAVVCSDGEILLHRQMHDGPKSNSGDRGSFDREGINDGLIPLATKIFNDHDDDSDEASLGEGTPRGSGNGNEMEVAISLAAINLANPDPTTKSDTGTFVVHALSDVGPDGGLLVVQPFSSQQPVEAKRDKRLKRKRTVLPALDIVQMKAKNTETSARNTKEESSKIEKNAKNAEASTRNLKEELSKMEKAPTPPPPNSKKTKCGRKKRTSPPLSDKEAGETAVDHLAKKLTDAIPADATPPLKKQNKHSSEAGSSTASQKSLESKKRPKCDHNSGAEFSEEDCNNKRPKQTNNANVEEKSPPSNNSKPVGRPPTTRHVAQKSPDASQPPLQNPVLSRSSPIKMQKERDSRREGTRSGNAYMLRRSGEAELQIEFASSQTNSDYFPTIPLLDEPVRLGKLVVRRYPPSYRRPETGFTSTLGTQNQDGNVMREAADLLAQLEAYSKRTRAGLPYPQKHVKTALENSQICERHALESYFSEEYDHFRVVYCGAMERAKKTDSVKKDHKYSLTSISNLLMRQHWGRSDVRDANELPLPRSDLPELTLSLRETHYKCMEDLVSISDFQHLVINSSNNHFPTEITG